MSTNTKVKLSVYGGLLLVLIILASLILQIHAIKGNEYGVKETWSGGVDREASVLPRAVISQGTFGANGLP